MSYMATWEDRYEPGEQYSEFVTLEEAQAFAGRILDDGGAAFITDEDGEEYDF